LFPLTLVHQAIAPPTGKAPIAQIQLHGFATAFRAIKPWPDSSKWTFRPRKGNTLVMLSEDEPRLTIADFASATIFQHGKAGSTFDRVPDAA
jgi:hypothetical protein